MNKIEWPPEFIYRTATIFAVRIVAELLIMEFIVAE